MGRFDIFDTIDEFRKAGRPFCVATVVRTADVTSAKAGAKAAVSESGEIIGHLGGGCVQRAVRKAGVEAIAAGVTQMIRVKPSEKVVSMQDDDGTPLYKSGCPSGGTVDVLIEPYELPPMLVIFGDTPISRALCAHGALAGYRIAVAKTMATDIEAARFDGTDIISLKIGPRDFVVVASQGSQDLASLRAAIESPAQRVSMVASRRKSEALCKKLVEADMPTERIARLKSPAGLDLKGIDPQEIALSVMAEIVMWRNADRKAEQGGSDESLA
jgi:xanthine dehydrogenase accessory factor